MKAIRLSAAEADVIQYGIDHVVAGGGALVKAALGLRKKLERAREATANVAVGPIEQALQIGARGKVVSLVTGHGQASVRAGKLGVTPEQARLVGEYLARTRWLTGPFTLLDVLNKWPQYLSKAQATQPPPEVPEGFGGSSGEPTKGAPRQSQGSEAGRPAPGFGGGRKNPHPDRDPGSR